ncbi:MAG: hypothetical protein K8U03_21050 [Planctomycetia bacterium]|nr:hypothetical protein [Planctomycetia bacterium]
MSAPVPVLSDIVGLFIRHPLRWALPAVVVAAIASLYAVTKPATWEAALTLTVRAEATGNQGGAGRFRDLSEMKTVQETVLELAKNRAVLEAALRKVGLPANTKVAAGAWPSGADIDDLSDALKLVPPKGAEFGSTEVFYLKVKDNDRARAMALADAVADELLARFQLLRSDKAQSMVRELGVAVDIARRDLQESVTTLGAFETRIGGDLAELRNLEQLGSGDSDLRKLVVELESELRQAENAERNNQELHNLLSAAQADSSRLLATPNRLLESQPALRRLKEGLIDAQLRTSLLLGSRSHEHPEVRASLDAQEEVRRHLHAELAAAAQGVAGELDVAHELVADRRQKAAAARGRLDRLASSRAEYSSLNSQMQYRTRQAEQSERQLVDARAAQAGGAASNLLTRLDKADAGTKPIGPGKTTLLGIGIGGGLMFGIGCLLLTTRLPDGSATTTQAQPSQADAQPVSAAPAAAYSSSDLRTARPENTRPANARTTERAPLITSAV